MTLYNYMFMAFFFSQIWPYLCDTRYQILQAKLKYPNKAHIA